MDIVPLIGLAWLPWYEPVCLVLHDKTKQLYRKFELLLTLRAIFM